MRTLTTSFKYTNHLRNYFSSRFNNLNATFSQPVFTRVLRKLHSTSRKPAKIYTDYENLYAYKILPQIEKFQPSWLPPKRITTIEEFNQFLDQNWRSSTASHIVEAFEKLQSVAIEINLPISDKRYDKLVDGLMDHCEKLTDEELLRLLLTLLEYPACESSDSHNFHDVWSCLDDICCWKMADWNLNKMYSFAEVWYKWHLGRLSDFVHELLDKVIQKPQRLSNNMLLYACFYLNINRRKTVPFEFEHILAQRIREFNVDQLALVAMCYFKTKTKIKTPEIVQTLIEAVKRDCETINEITLSAILKVIRLSQRAEISSELLPLMDTLTTQIPRLTNLALIHILLLGTSLQIKHEPIILKCLEKLQPDVENLRLKDLERTLLVCSMYNIKTDFYNLVAKEIHKDSRRQEFILYSRSLPSTLNYLSQREFYSNKLMNEVLNEDFINETYGKSARNVPRDLFSLDCCIDVECLDYEGNRLSPHKRYKAAKWLSEYAPSFEQQKKLSHSDRAYLEVTKSVIDLVKEERFLRHDHVLPHFSKPDIILCKNRETGRFVEPFGFQNYYLGDIKRPFDLETFQWFSIIILTPNLAVRNTCEPLGSIVMKERQLKKIGYKPVLICTNLFTTLSVTERSTLLQSHLT